MAPSRMAKVISLFHSATAIQILDFVNALNRNLVTMDLNSLYSSGTLILQRDLEKYKLQKETFNSLPWVKEMGKEYVGKVRETKASTEVNRLRTYYVTILGMKAHKWDKDSRMLYGVLFGEQI